MKPSQNNAHDHLDTKEWFLIKYIRLSQSVFYHCKGTLCLCLSFNHKIIEKKQNHLRSWSLPLSLHLGIRSHFPTERSAVSHANGLDFILNGNFSIHKIGSGGFARNSVTPLDFTLPIGCSFSFLSCSFCEQIDYISNMFYFDLVVLYLTHSLKPTSHL